jgi:ABC-2 type transport system permease protein
MNTQENIPSSFSQVATVIQYTFIDYIRSKRFIILLAIVLAVSAVLIGVAAYSGLSILFIWGAFAPIMTMLSAIFFGADAISGEFQNKTGYFSLPNPIKRSTVYFGKWLAAYAASSVMLAVFAVITFAASLASGVATAEFGYSLLFGWFFLAAAVGFTFLCSSTFKNTTNSIFVAAMLLLVVFTAVTNLSGIIPLEPWFILNYAAGIIGNVLTVPYPTQIITGVDMGKGIVETAYSVTIPEGIAIIATYLAVTTILGAVLFQKEEFT